MQPLFYVCICWSWLDFPSLLEKCYYTHAKAEHTDHKVKNSLRKNGFAEMMVQRQFAPKIFSYI